MTPRSPGWSGIAVLCLAVGLLGACGSGSATAAATRAASTTAAPRPSGGCNGAPVTVGVQQLRAMVGGHERSWRQYVPQGYDGRTPLPLLLNIHGISSNADQQADVTQFEKLAADKRFIVVEPNGVGLVQFWNITETALAADDVAFAKELVAKLGASLCVDTARVYSAGLSNGGLMSHLLACRLPGTFAAVASVSAAFHPDGCTKDPAISVLAMHGDQDPILPRTGGIGNFIVNMLGSQLLLQIDGGLAQQRAMIPDIKRALKPPVEAMAGWVGQLGCGHDPAVTRVSAHITASTWTGCHSGAEVVFYDMAGAGHIWPRLPGTGGGLASAGKIVGPDNTEVDATAIIWDFFAAHHR